MSLSKPTKPMLLLVSSDGTIRESVIQTLSSTYDLKIALNGTDGHRILLQHSIEIQLVILDTTLLDMKAQEWMHLVGQDFLPYTLLVADDRHAEWMITAMQSGVVDIMHKNPFSISELVLAVAQGFEYSRVTQYLARVAQHTQNKTIHTRLNSFLELLKIRKSEGRVMSPNEIALYFPASDVSQELPLPDVLSAIESGETFDLIKKWKERPKFLVVDDEFEVRDALSIQFGLEFEMFVADSCESALQLLQQEGTAIDVAILDIGLPGMSGDEFVSVLMQKFPNIQILMLTGYSEHRLITKTINDGACDYIVKPYNATSLKQKVFGLLQSSILNRVLGGYMQAAG